MKKLLLIALLFTLQPTFACLNEIRVLLNGKTKISGEESPVPYGKNYFQKRNEIESKLKEVYKDWIENKNLDDYSDYGVLLVYLGEYQKALKVYENIEIIMPGLYTTAANIGTIYELLGKNDLAYKWIEKAISIDSKSHDGSEWLHLKILEVKMGKKPLTTSFFLDTEFGESIIPKSNIEKNKLRDLKFQIYYQLNERVSFIKPKDEIVALLLFELGNICAITDDATSAYRVYRRAKEYGYHSDLFERRYAFVEKLQLSLDKKLREQKKNKENSKDYAFPIIILSVILLITISILLLRKRKRIS